MAEIAEILPSLAIDQLVIGILMINREGQVCLFNQALAKMTGLNQHDVLGQSLYPPNKLLQTFATGREFQNLQPSTILPVMGLNNCTTSTHIVRGKSGVPVGAMAVFLPAGQQQELEEAVIKAEKLAILGQMAAEMAHEIRNPLTVINGFMTLLQEDLTGTPKEKYVSIIRDELKHVNNLISDFLQFSRPGYAKRTRCSIVQIITDVTMLVDNEASLRNLEIDLELAEDIPDILGDIEQLKQVALNRTDHSQGNALVAAGRLDNNGALLKYTFLFSSFQHTQRRPGFGAAAGINHLKLSQYARVTAISHFI
jgi:signal transduction histidine kinase